MNALHNSDPDGSANENDIGFRIFVDQATGVEVLRATLTHHAFEPHFHETFLIGFTCAGAERFTQNGRVGRSLPGQVRIIEPGVVHTGEPAGETPWCYMAMYVPPAAFDGLVSDREVLPNFGRPVLDDPTLFTEGAALVSELFSAADPSEHEERLATLLLRLSRHHRDSPPDVRGEPEKIALAREYIRHRMATTVRLDELAAVVGLSKFHLLRTFKMATGLTPWRYQVQLRLAAARNLLRDGTPPSQVAVICGFFDQSHFTRLFRASFGITPAAFALAHRKSRTTA